MVVEDLISTGKSSLIAVEALREANVKVKGMVAIFTYGFDVATENFEKAGVDLHTLGDYDSMLIQAEKSRYIAAEELTLLSSWRKDPSNWNPSIVG